MPNSIDVSATYEGQHAAEFIAPAIISGKMLEQGLITPYLSIKSEMKIPLMKLDGIIQVYATDFNADPDTVQISDRVLNPKAFTVNLEFPINVLESLHISAQMAAGMANSSVPLDFQTFVIAYVIKHIKKSMDMFMWNSDTSNSGVLSQFDGLIKLMANDADVVKPTIAALTEANIITELNKVYTAIPEDSSEDENLKVFVSVAAHKLYKQALAKLHGITPNKKVQASMLYDENIDLVSIPKFPANTIVATSSNNLAFGTDLTSDAQTFQIVDMRFTTNDRKVRFRVDFKVDVNYGFGEEVVYAKAA